MANTDRPAGLLRLPRDPLLEEAEQVALDLAAVFGEGGELRLEEARDVLVVVGLERPAEPDVRDRVRRQSLDELPGKNRGLPEPGKTASSATAPADR